MLSSYPPSATSTTLEATPTKMDIIDPMDVYKERSMLEWIFIVDDDDLMRRTVRRTFMTYTKYDRNFYEAKSGSDALEKLIQYMSTKELSGNGLIVSDQNMPIKGVDFAKSLRESGLKDRLNATLAIYTSDSREQISITLKEEMNENSRKVLCDILHPNSLRMASDFNHEIGRGETVDLYVNKWDLRKSLPIMADAVISNLSH